VACRGGDVNSRYDALVTLVVTSSLLVVVCGVAAALLAPWLLRRTPEPELEPDEVKIPYVARATWRFSLAAGAWAAALATAAVIGVDPARVGPWLVVAVVGALASVVDIATTWIPRRWLHVGWVLTALAVTGSAWSRFAARALKHCSRPPVALTWRIDNYATWRRGEGRRLPMVYGRHWSQFTEP